MTVLKKLQLSSAYGSFGKNHRMNPLDLMVTKESGDPIITNHVVQRSQKRFRLYFHKGDDGYAFILNQYKKGKIDRVKLFSPFYQNKLGINVFHVVSDLCTLVCKYDMSAKKVIVLTLWREPPNLFENTRKRVEK